MPQGNPMSDQVESLRSDVKTWMDNVETHMKQFESSQNDMSKNQAVFMDRTERIMDNVEELVPAVAGLQRGVESLERTIAQSVFPEITAAKEQSREAKSLAEQALAAQKAGKSQSDSSFLTSTNFRILALAVLVMSIAVAGAMGIELSVPGFVDSASAAASPETTEPN